MDKLPTLDDVYRKFGSASEAAQLLETELGTLLLFLDAADKGLLAKPDATVAGLILNGINRQTLGMLIKNAKGKTPSLDRLEALLSKALEERNRLSHSFYRQHNFRRNSGEGRTLMMQDLESIHSTLIEAYKALLLLSGTDLDAELAAERIISPIGHVPI